MYHCLNCSHASEEKFKFCPTCGTEATATADKASLIGKVLNGKYRIIEEVGAGAMGTVYRAEQVSLKKPIAIKVLHQDLMVNDESVRRFHAEGIAAGKFTHPSAIQIFDFDKDGSGNWFLAMEFVEGKSLKDYIAEKGALSADGAVSLMIQVLDALAEAHREGIIHRDLKPDNIMVVGSGSGELLVKVLDFGLSKLVDTGAGSALMTQTGRILGTPRYMAPEQWQGTDVDHRIDIYAAGLVLFEMITGESPVSGTTMQDAMLQSATDPVPSLLSSKFDIEVPRGLEEIVTRALAKDREGRYPNAQEMIDDLHEIDFDTRAKKRRQQVRRGSSAARRRGASAGSAKTNPVMLWGGIAVGVAVVVFLVMQFIGGDTRTYVRLTAKPAADRTEEENRYVQELRTARDALRERRIVDALSAVERARVLPCVDSEVYFVRALIYRAKHDDKTAKLDCEDAIKRDGDYAEAIAELGWIHFDLGEWSDAESQFDQAVARNATLAAAVVGRASIQVERGAADEARALLQSVDESTASASVQLRLGGAYLGLREFDDAVAAFTSAKRANAFDWRAHAGVGEAMLHKDDPDQARPALIEAVNLNPDAMASRVSLATLYIDAGQWPEALKVVEDGLARQSDHGRLQVLKGVVLFASGRVDDAIPALEAGTSRSPRDHRAWTLLGVLYQQRGRYQDAIDCYLKAEDIDRNRTQPFLDHGLCLMAMKKYTDAEPLILRAMDLDQENSYALLSYGVLAMDYLGKAAEALDAFQRYKRLGGEDPRVDGWIKKLSGG